MDTRVLRLALVVGFAAVICGENKDSYLRRRHDFVKSEASSGTGGGVVFTQKEAAVNELLMKLKHEEISKYRQQGNGRVFPPARPFMKTRGKIEKSEIFKILRAMPKGAALHVHDMAITDLRWIIANLTYHPKCFMCLMPGGQIKLGFFDSRPQEKDCMWVKVKNARSVYSSPEAFDDMLYSKMSMDDGGDISKLSQDELWVKFLSCFTALEGLFLSEIGFDAYLTRGLQDFYDDNVQYIEIRGLFMNVSRSDGSHYDTTWLLQAYRDVAQRFKDANPDFVGMKNIVTVIRALGHDDVTAGLQQAHAWKRQFPDQIAGFDLVAQEDPGHPLSFFIDELLEFADANDSHVPYIFHAGETNWIGQDVDNNLIDAVLLNTTRIGHGYAIVHHPAVLKYVQEHGVALEMNPISNQVLGLVSDLRNHPGAMLMALGVPVVISSDDPALWGASGLSHDYYEAFMGFTGGWGNLGTLKTLALDSIRYSSMSADERDQTMDIWNRKWEEFLDNVIQKYELTI